MAGTASKPQVASTTTNSPLHDLPIELLEWILPYLESEDLFNLRLASTELAAKTVQYMARTYFTWLHIFMLDSSGMSRLIWIAKHPVYRSAVKRIEFNVAVLQDPDDYEYGPWTRSPDRTPEKIAEYRTLYAASEEFRPQARYRLKLVLNLFHLAGNVPAISAEYGSYMPHLPSGSPGAWGAKNLFRKHGNQVLTKGGGLEEQNAYDSLCWAILESAAQIRALQLGDSSHQIDPWILGHAMLVYPHRTPFTYLRSLTLSLPHHGWYRGSSGAEERQHVQMIQFSRISIMTLVAQAEQLEYLSLACAINCDDKNDRDFDRTIFRSLVEDKLPAYPTALQHIVEIDLCGHDIPKKMLLTFIHNHRTTLKAMELEEITDGSLDDLYIKQDIFAAAQDIVDFKLKIQAVYEGAKYDFERQDRAEWETIESWNCSSNP